METKTVGPWVLEARLGYWNESGEGLLSVKNVRTNEVRYADLYRFPAGWRSGAIDRLDVPKYIKSAAHGLIRRLP